MELRTYLRVMLARWQIVVPTLLITFVASLVFTIMQVPLYESVATYVVRLSVPQGDERVLLSALGTLSNPEVVGTFVEVANSRQVKSQAADELGLSDEERRQIIVTGQTVPGTNVMQIAVEGPNPSLARDFASAVGAKTAASVRGIYGMYELQLLDDATIPPSPSKPNVPLNLLLGIVTGLLLGAGMAFLSHYLLSPDTTYLSPETNFANQGALLREADAAPNDATPEQRAIARVGDSRFTTVHPQQTQSQ